MLKSAEMCESMYTGAHVGIPGVINVRSCGLSCMGGEIMRLDARLKRLESQAERPPVVITVVWDDDDNRHAAPGARIRLCWGDDREPS
jgi:hypothetical protein